MGFFSQNIFWSDFRSNHLLLRIALFQLLHYTNILIKHDSIFRSFTFLIPKVKLNLHFIFISPNDCYQVPNTMWYSYTLMLAFLPPVEKWYLPLWEQCAKIYPIYWHSSKIFLPFSDKYFCLKSQLVHVFPTNHPGWLKYWTIRTFHTTSPTVADYRENRTC